MCPVLTSVQVGGEWSASRPRYPLDKTLGGPTGPEDVERRKILPLSGLELQPLGRPVRSRHCTDCATINCITGFIFCPSSPSSSARTRLRGVVLRIKMPVLSSTQFQVERNGYKWRCEAVLVTYASTEK
jgi:hypothetical protein